MNQYRLYLMIVACLALACLVWFDNQQPSPMASAPPIASGEPQDQTDPDLSSNDENKQSSHISIGNPLVAISKDELRDTVERPLFAPTRRRPVETDTAKHQDTTLIGEKPVYELLGVVLNGDRAIALLRNAADGTSFRVESGDMVGSWRVATVEAASVFLERSDGTPLSVSLNH
ncbi:hypothetical protein [Hyphomicrobium facile]|uniref:Type II secretion system protein GspC N-terminal domain-containing protein n=1 Tax=Hyphomicrobium facile TaxID=51670 RepID=A0A1I7N4I8_9HYPH|nr:hypothetical protein [Hyphomicrobium facile]SFV29575.1 hypothetical protein SAMN04488557_1283 [Hyphomicrobium facile]